MKFRRKIRVNSTVKRTHDTKKVNYTLVLQTDVSCIPRCLKKTTKEGQRVEENVPAERESLDRSARPGASKVLLSLNPRISSHRAAMQDNADVDGQVD